MADGAHHSIGEVLSLLKEEHEDVTISKIRFLESQGLIEPERTPSGYRKFYDSDIERLRWILAQQRDNFLPLKVIKRRLEDAGFDPASELSPRDAGPLPEPTLFARRPDTDGATSVGADTTVDLRESVTAATPDQAAEVAPSAAAVSEPALDPERVSQGPASRSPVRSEARPEPAPISDHDPMAIPAGSVSMSAGELADAVGCDLSFIGELEKLGLIVSVDTDEGAAFDHEAMVVAKAAVDLRTRGLEPRHLRMFKVSADRESGVLQQLVGPLMKKGGDAQVRGRGELNELVRLGETIRRSILRRSFDTPSG